MQIYKPICYNKKNPARKNNYLPDFFYLDRYYVKT